MWILDPSLGSYCVCGPVSDGVTDYDQSTNQSHSAITRILDPIPIITIMCGSWIPSWDHVTSSVCCATCELHGTVSDGVIDYYQSTNQSHSAITRILDPIPIITSMCGSWIPPWDLIVSVIEYHCAHSALKVIFRRLSQSMHFVWCYSLSAISLQHGRDCNAWNTKT